MTLANPRWYLRIDAIRSALENFPQALIDRRQLKVLFKVSDRTAGRLIRAMAGQPGDTPSKVRITVSKAQAFKWLDVIEESETHLTRLYYRQKLLDSLQEQLWGSQLAYQRAQRLRREIAVDDADKTAKESEEQVDVRFTVPMANVIRPTIDGLPEGVELGAGFVRVSFAAPDEALPKLFALAQVIGHNWPAFASTTSRDPLVIADRLRRGLP